MTSDISSNNLPITFQCITFDEILIEYRANYGDVDILDEASVDASTALDSLESVAGQLSSHPSVRTVNLGDGKVGFYYSRLNRRLLNILRSRNQFMTMRELEDAYLHLYKRVLLNDLLLEDMTAPGDTLQPLYYIMEAFLTSHPLVISSSNIIEKFFAISPDVYIGNYRKVDQSQSVSTSAAATAAGRLGLLPYTPSGNGKLIMQSGDFYRGTFSDGLMHGKGVYFQKSTKIFAPVEYQMGVRK
jgi:hypothetical protein